MTLLRSLLFVPGNRANMLEKSLGFAPDAYTPDLEDSVPVDEKLRARDMVASFLPRMAGTGIPIIPRVNSLDSGLLEDDLAALLGPHILAVSVGKVQSAADIAYISRTLSRLERAAGLDTRPVKIIPWIESAMAVVNAYEIGSASARILGMAFGAGDFVADMAIQRTEGDAEIAYPRSVVGVAARAAGVLALDTPYFGYRDPEGLARDIEAAKRFGFAGKFAIHPAQVDTINAAFSPSPAEIEHARRVVAAFEEAERSGSGSTSLDGEMIDIAVAVRARDLLTTAERSRQDGKGR